MTQNFRMGDVVTIRAVVTADKCYDPTKVFIRPKGHHSEIFVDLDQVELVHRFFTPRDRVVGRETGFAGEVVATFDDQCWVRFDSGNLATIEANDLLLEEPKLGVAA